MATKSQRRGKDAALVSRITDALQSELQARFGPPFDVEVTILDPYVLGDQKVTAEAVIGFELEERLVDVIIYTVRDLPTPKPLPSSTLLETGRRGATVYNFDLPAQVRDAVKEALADAFDISPVDYGKVSTNGYDAAQQLSAAQ
jgi:hypothetical protein